MSAIWGAIDLERNRIASEIQEKMKKPYRNCVLDRTEYLCEDNILMNCGIQYFTPEAKREKLPICTERYAFTADVVLDNRLELKEKYPEFVDLSQPDGDILFRLISNRGKECLNDILGVYSAVLYDKKKNEIFLFTDATGQRVLYYRQIGSVFYFSTLMNPLIEVTEDRTLNDRWLMDFLAMDYLFMVNETTETPIKEILRLAPAEAVTVKRDVLEKEIYWDPFVNFKENVGKTDEEYKKEFLTVWEKAVTSQIRSENPISILLSGGLDSTAVAAIAAPYLKKKGKKLYSYTSVPSKGYQSNNDGYYIDNEQADVEKTVEYFGNMEPTYIDLEGKNAWELRKEEMKCMEIPYKSCQNLLWIRESMERAYQNHSRIMLNGSYGNTSISYTNMNVFFNMLYGTGQKRRLQRELKLFSANMGFDKDYACSQIQKEMSEDYRKAGYSYRYSFVNREYADQMECDERIEEINRKVYEANKDYELERRQRINWLAMRQIGETDTKHSLYTGVLRRDPTQDKRVLEFCLHIPLDCYCKEGVDRRLVKEYLKDLIPTHVITFGKQGRQSADFQYRFKKDWEKIRLEWISIYEKHLNSRYVDSAWARRQLMEQKNIEEYQSYDLNRHIYTLMLLEYEEKYGTPRVAERGHVSDKYCNNELISVIVPVFQAEKTLEKCVNSICSQTYKNLEIILVDDGSVDASPKICEELSQKDSRIKVIHQDNQGVSAARNQGLKIANGELIAFVDSDDWLESEMYDKLYEMLTEHNADVSGCAYSMDNEGKMTAFSTGKVTRLYQGEILDTLITGHGKCVLTPAVWNKIYRRTLIGDTIFQKSNIGEDYLFNVQVFKNAKKMVYVQNAYYHYVQNDTGLTGKKKSYDYFQNFIHTQQTIMEELAGRLLEESMCKKYYNYYMLLLDQYCRYHEFAEPDQCKKILAKELLRIKQYVKTSIQGEISHGKRYQIQLQSALIHPELYRVSLLMVKKMRAMKRKITKF